jgi:hypothetical protein
VRSGFDRGARLATFVRNTRREELDMATTQPHPRGGMGRTTPGADTGWLAYCGILVLIGGVLNVIWGIAAIDGANFFVANAHYVISDLNLWGWVSLVIGAVLIAAGVGIFAGARWAVWAGIAFASVNAIVQLLAIPSYPLWSLAVFALDLLAVYGLLTHGTNMSGESTAARRT